MITVESLTKTFHTERGAVRALDGVSLEVSPGAICGVVGPDGAGKTTLARCISLQDRPDSGAVRVDGTDLVALDGSALRTARRQIGMVSHDDSPLRQRTAAGNVALPLEAAGLTGAKRRSRVAELLDLVGLADKAAVHPDRLTRGQQRRVAIARALAAKPSVLLADEPTAGLDPDNTGSVLTVLDRVRAELGLTVVAVTGDMGVVRRIADDVVVLEDGRVVEQGKVMDLVTEPGSLVGSTLLPGTGQGEQAGSPGRRHDVVAEVVLVGFAAVGALLPEAASRFGVDLAILGGGLTRLGDTPVARFRIGFSGERSESALKWIIERDAVVRRAPVCVEGVAA